MMLDIEMKDITIALPLGTCDDYARNLINYFIENFEVKIVIVYRIGQPEDYVVHPRVKYVKNIVEKRHAMNLNQCIKESETEYILLSNWKYIFTREALLFAIDKLKNGYGLVDLLPCYGVTLFSKHLISIIGFYDEWLHHNYEHEWDQICRLKHYNIALYQEKKCTQISRRTMHQGSRSNEAFKNYEKMAIKWKYTPDGFIMNFPEKNSNEKRMYKNQFQERTYLPFKDSHITFKYAYERCNLWKSGVSCDNISDFSLDDTEVELYKTGIENIEYE